MKVYYRIKESFIIIVLFMSFISCNKNYSIYEENNIPIAQLLNKDKSNQIAYLLDINGNLIKNRGLIKKIAEFYNLDGYQINLYDTLDLKSCEILNQDITEIPINSFDKILPYDYRREYVDNNGDTTAYLLQRNNMKGILYTPTKMDEMQLKTIIQYLHLDYCSIYDYITTDLNSKFGNYSQYNKGTISFRNTEKEVLHIGNTILELKQATSKYKKYYSKDKLNFEQILGVLEILKFPQEIIYFFTNDEKLDYASAININDVYNIGIFDIDKIYRVKYDTNSLEWNTIEEF